MRLIENLKKKEIMFGVKIQNTAATLAEDLKTDKVFRAIMAAYILLIVLVLSANSAFAAVDIFDKAAEAGYGLIADFTKISGVLAGLGCIICLVVAIVCYMFGAGQSASKTLGYAGKIILAWIAINAAGWIFAFLKNLVSGGALTKDSF